MKILFILVFPSLFPDAGWTRIGFFANAWSKKGHLVEVLGAFSYREFKKRGTKRVGNINIFNLTFNMGLAHLLGLNFHNFLSVGILI